MPREYRHIKQYEKEILELKEKGLTKREIGEKFGLSKEQIKGFLKEKEDKKKKYLAGYHRRRKADLRKTA